MGNIHTVVGVDEAIVQIKFIQSMDFLTVDRVSLVSTINLVKLLELQLLYWTISRKLYSIKGINVLESSVTRSKKSIKYTTNV